MHMNGILELEKTEVSPNTDTWIMRLPREICQREGLAEGTLVSMTVKDGGIRTKFVSPPAEKLSEIGKKILKEDHELHERLRKIGD